MTIITEKPHFLRIFYQTFISKTYFSKLIIYVLDTANGEYIITRILMNQHRQNMDCLLYLISKDCRILHKDSVNEILHNL